MTSSFERGYGALIGQAVGDALGAPTEGLTRVQIVERYGWVSDVPDDGPAGTAGDDPAHLDDGAVARAVPVGICRAGRPERAAASEQHPTGANGGGPRD